MSAWWILPAIVIGLIVAATLVPPQLLEELLQHSFLLVREPFIILRDWSRSGFRTTKLWLKSGLLSIGLSRHNWPLRMPVLLFLGIGYILSVCTFVLNFVPVFSGLFGGDPGATVRHLPWLIAAEIASAALCSAIVVFEVTGLTHLGLERELATLGHIRKGILATIVVGVLAGSLALAYEAGILRAMANQFDPATEGHMQLADVPVSPIVRGQGISGSVDPASPVSAMPLKAQGPAKQVDTQNTYEKAATTLLTFVSIVSLLAGAFTFMGYPATLFLLCLLPLILVPMALCGVFFLVGEGGERLVNALYNVAASAFRIVGHLGSETRRAARWRPVDSTVVPSPDAPATPAYSAGAASDPGPASVVAAVTPPASSGFSAPSADASSFAPPPSADDRAGDLEGYHQNSVVEHAEPTRPEHGWNPLGIDSEED